MKNNAPTVAFLFLLTLALFAEVIFTGTTFIARDTYLFYNPRQFFAAESMRQGIMPLWNPYVACGVPFQANLQSALFYPFGLLYSLLPFQQGFKLFIVFHYFLGAAFMFALMREWGSGRRGALLAGIVFSFGGYLSSLQDNVAFLAAGIWLPLILLCFHRALSRSSPAYAVATAFCIAAQVFAGDASFTLLSSCIATALYSAARCIGAPRGSAKKAAGAFLLAWCLGLALAAVQLLPFLEFAARSHRFPGLEFAQAAKWSYHPLELAQLLIPYPFGTTVPMTRWFGQLWLDTAYIGIFPLALAFMGLVSERGRLRWFLSALLAFGLLLALGSHTPLYEALYGLFPVFKMLQYPVKFLFPAVFALSILAGRGFDRLGDIARSGTTTALTAGILCCAAAALLLPLLGELARGDALYAAFLRWYPAQDYFRPIAQQQYYALLAGCSLALGLLLLFACALMAARMKAIPPRIVALLVLAITVIDLRMARPEDPLIQQDAIARQSRTAALLGGDPSLFRVYSLARFYVKNFAHVYGAPFDGSYRLLRESLRANLNIYDHIASAEEYSEMLNRAFYDLFLPVEDFFSGPGNDPQLRAYCRMLLGLLNVKYIVSPVARPDLGLKPVADQPVHVYENEQALPRAFFPEQVECFASEDEVLARMRQPGFDPRQAACILSGPDAPHAPEQGGAAASRPRAWSVTWTGYTPQRSSLKAVTDKPGLLVISDTWYPGWKAFVDGRESPLVKANHFMRGLALEAGSHEVSFVFRPFSFTAGACISAAAACMGLWLLRRRRRDANAAGGGAVP